MKHKIRRSIDLVSKRPAFTAILAFLISAVTMTVYEVLKETFFSGISTWQSHSITIAFTSILASGLAYLVANNGAEISSELIDIDERLALYDAAMTASMHSVGNALNLFHVIQIESENGGVISESTLKLIELELVTTKEFMKDLSLIENPTSEAVMEFLQNSLKKNNA